MMLVEKGHGLGCDLISRLWRLFIVIVIIFAVGETHAIHATDRVILLALHDFSFLLLNADLSTSSIVPFLEDQRFPLRLTYRGTYDSCNTHLSPVSTLCLDVFVDGHNQNGDIGG